MAVKKESVRLPGYLILVKVSKYFPLTGSLFFFISVFFNFGYFFQYFFRLHWYHKFYNISRLLSSRWKIFESVRISTKAAGTIIFDIRSCHCNYITNIGHNLCLLRFSSKSPRNRIYVWKSWCLRFLKVYYWQYILPMENQNFLGYQWNGFST